MADDDSFDLSGIIDDSDLGDLSAPEFGADLGADLSGDLGADLSGDLGADLSDDLGADSDLSSSGVSGIDAFDTESTPNDEFAAPEDDDGFVAPKVKRRRRSGLSVFDGMLLGSLILITLASLWMVIGLQDYGGLFSLPWKTSGITVK